MPERAPSDHIELLNVRVSPNGIAEMDQGRALVFVPRSGIVHVELKHGSGAERPVLNCLIAVALLGVSALPLVMLFNALRGSGIFEAKFITAVAFVVPAVWLLDLTLRRRWFLSVQQRRGNRKILFARGADESQVRQFWLEVCNRFGYL